jgi:hypothetical protein
MKKLLDLTPEVQDRLKRIGDAISKHAEEDPYRATYTCYRCSDTGLIVTDEPHRFYGTIRMGRPCPYCQNGIDFARQEVHTQQERHKFRAERMKGRSANRLVLVDGPIEGDGDEIPF